MCETTGPLALRKENESLTAHSPGVNRALLREDTVVLPGCTCGKAQLTCNVEKLSNLCWGKKSTKRYYCMVISLSAICVVSLIGTIFFSFSNPINNAILNNMVIKNNSAAYAMWKTPAVRPRMRVHVFNYTNWERVRDGYEERLTVEDIGPFVYTQYMDRVNVKFEDDLVTFQERNSYIFEPTLSKGAQYEHVQVPNLPLMGVISKATSMKLAGLVQYSLNSALGIANHGEAFVSLPVHRFLWGYDDSIIDLAKPFLSLQGRLKFDRFGLLVTKNGTNSEILTINTGEKDLNQINIIEKVDGRSELSYWSSPECNSVTSSDGTIFPPSQLDRKSHIYIFFSNLCRRVPFVYEKDVETEDGVQLLRYRMPADVFDDPEHNPHNGCYCEMESGECPPRGIVNVTACTMGVPAVASLPHFLRGDPKLLQDIGGLHPDPVLHDFYLDIHPTLGIALNGKTGIQINMQIQKTNMFTSLRYLKQGLILPIAWIEMTVDELPDSVRSLIYHGTFSSAAAHLALTWLFILSLIASSSSLLLLFYKKRQRPCATIKKVPSNDDK